MADADGLAAGTGITWQNEFVGVVEYAADKNQMAIFYTEGQPDPQQSQAQGRPVFKDTVMVRIAPPGERLNVVIRPATQRDAHRWPTQWNQFLQNKKQAPDGTPVEMLFPATPSVAATLKANGVFTVEQCSELSGNAIDNIGMGTQKWVNAAKRYLEVANRGVKASQMQHELDERDGHIRVLKRQVEDLTAAVNRLQAMINHGVVVQQETFVAQSSPRPQHMPHRAFDAQTAQINATSPTAQVTQARRQSVKKAPPPPAQEKRRPRPRLTV